MPRLEPLVVFWPALGKMQQALSSHTITTASLSNPWIFNCRRHPTFVNYSGFPATVPAGRQENDSGRTVLK